MAIPTASVVGFATGVLFSNYLLRNNTEQTFNSKEEKSSKIMEEIIAFDKSKLKIVKTNDIKNKDDTNQVLERLSLELSDKIKHMRSSVKTESD